MPQPLTLSSRGKEQVKQIMLPEGDDILISSIRKEVISILEQHSFRIHNEKVPEEFDEQGRVLGSRHYFPVTSRALSETLFSHKIIDKNNLTEKQYYNQLAYTLGLEFNRIYNLRDPDMEEATKKCLSGCAQVLESLKAQLEIARDDLRKQTLISKLIQVISP